jgi:hypothetical protein
MLMVATLLPVARLTTGSAAAAAAVEAAFGNRHQLRTRRQSSLVSQGEVSDEMKVRMSANNKGRHTVFFLVITIITITITESHPASSLLSSSGIGRHRHHHIVIMSPPIVAYHTTISAPLPPAVGRLIKCHCWMLPRAEEVFVMVLPAFPIPYGSGRELAEGCCGVAMLRY